ncbi:golgin subfamily A member 3-like isoform X2 [Mercenaria mercenaria]|uniref:golgin subfamily A member 3-like isoform X2 n=1 Tax=Mercenaria mercenaria TaxID=6596 RepID=UPI00234ECABC|nr:golgin subfamily A member 3-like isoform X2 [Mercenaria mercenaria]
MEPYNLRLQQLTFNEDQLQDGSLDSFSNVIHYDSALLDQTTGKKQSTTEVENSIQFAWLNPKQAHKSQKLFLPTPFQEVQTTLSSKESFLPSPFQDQHPQQDLQAGQNIDQVAEKKTDDFATEINQLIKDVYSEVEVPFNPLQEQKTIPDWIFLQQSLHQDRNSSREVEHFIAQPSRVKVTHVYNQTVWSQVPATASYDTPHISKPQVKLSASDIVVKGTDINTLQQISSNTTAARQYHRPSRMADKGTDAGNGNPSEPFESVAEALHLQQSVIGNSGNITPVSADVVAQIVAEAERKIKLGQAVTPTPLDAHIQKSPSFGTSTTAGAATDQPDQPSFSLPPAPRLPDAATTRELIRIHSLDITRSSGGTAREQEPTSLPQQPPGLPSPHTNSAGRETNPQSGDISLPNRVPISHVPNEQKTHIPQTTASAQNTRPVPTQGMENVPDDNQSVASFNSELESLTENATDSFLQSLPPLRHVNLSDIMPEPKVQDMQHSPPVKETSFRPLNVKVDAVQSDVMQQSPAFQTFVTDSGVFSPESVGVVSPASNTLPQNKTRFVIPKPGPLFQSTPRKAINIREHLQKPVHSSNTETSSQIEEVRREKAKLEGQLEMLSIEAQATLQERAELQAQVASLKLKLMSQKTQRNDAENDVLKADLESLKQLRISLEQSVSDLQRQLEERSEEGRNLQEDLNQSQEQCDKLNLRMTEIRDELRTKEVTIQALKNKVAELYVEVQTSMHTKMEADNEARSAKSELVSLQSTKDWYQQQLEIASKARSELQKELTMLQAQAVSQSSIIDRLKSENTKLRQQFTDIQNKALKEKELLAKHLETIESDMMDREAAFQEIQRERSFLEDTFNTKIQTAEDEKNRISLLMQMTNDLENQLDKAHSDLKKKQNQIIQLETENIELMKKLSLSQETVTEKETMVEDLKHNLIELDARLKAFQNSMVNKDTEILQLKEEKAKTEIALNAALLEKSSVDKVLDGLKSDMGKVESSFKLMRQELNTKSLEVTKIRSDGKSSEEQVEKLKTELENERRSYELTKSEFENKSEHINELQGQKVKLESEVLVLREKLSSMEVSHEEAMREKQILDTELGATREKLEEVNQKLRSENEVEQERLQKSSVDDSEFKKVQDECVQLREKVEEMSKDGKKDLMKQKAKSAKLSQDLNAVKTELMERQKTFDENIELLSAKLREVATEKEKLETELTMVHRKYEFSMLEQKDQIGAELQKLASELHQVRLDKHTLESQFAELQHARDSDLNQYHQQLSALEEDLRLALESQRETAVTEETNTELLLKLEKEKGRLAGLMQSNATLKQHVAQLEEALASRESTLVEMQAQWTQNMREKELESHESLKRVQALEESLQKEKDGQREIRKQIGLKITDNKKLKRLNDALKQDQDQLKQDVSLREQEISMLQTELETSKEEVIARQAEITSLETENKSVQRELERVQQQLYDNLAREPVIQEQIKSLEWQLELKSKELEAVQTQAKHSEDRLLAETESIRHLLHEKTSEIENLKIDIATMKHDKQVQQAKVSELRSALKSSIQYHKLIQKMSKLQSVSGSGDAGTTELPPLPFDIADMDKLLQETTVRALESKPLDNLQNCLLNLRSEISGLQAQMDVHNSTIETSTNTWSTIEQQVAELTHAVQTISNTTMNTSTTASLAAAAVDMVDKSMGIIDV